MAGKKPIAITLLGWIFIIFSLLVLVGFPKVIAAYYKLLALSAGLPSLGQLGADLPLKSISFVTIPAILSMFLLYFITGMGILRLKRWAYYLALIIPFLYFADGIKNIWFFGLSSANTLPVLLFSGVFSFIIFIILMRKDSIEKFNAAYVTKKGRRVNPKKFILTMLIVFVLLHIITAGSWSLLVNLKYRPSSAFGIKPQKVVYRIEDEEFIFKKCQKRNIFDFSIYIPKEWQIGMVSRSRSSPSWNLTFFSRSGDTPKAFIMIDSKGMAYAFSPLAKACGLKDAYDFERKINYPSLSPIYSTLKMIQPGMIQSIDEANTPEWRGFIKVSNRKERILYDASLYGLKRDKTCNVLVSSSESSMLTPEQAKSIIASLKFDGGVKSSRVLFDEGKNNLSQKDYVSAALNFINALYIEERNPEYAYYLGRSLFEDNEDSNVKGKKLRMYSAKCFLEYALELKPDYQEAKDLIAVVSGEIEKIK